MSSKTEQVQSSDVKTKSSRRLPAKLGHVSLAIATAIGGGFVGSKLNQNSDSNTERTKTEVSTSATENDPSLVELQSQVDTLTQIVASQAGVSVETVRGELTKPEQLPGYGTAVSPEIRNNFESSVLKMGKRLKGDPNALWQEVCTANKITYAGHDYVATAAHCLQSDMSDMTAGGKGGGGLAVDITDMSMYEYAVLDANIPSEQRTVEPVAQASRVMVGVGFDFAMFEVVSTPEFEAVGSLQIADTVSSITPGVDVALRSLPSSSGNEPVVTTGTYLGRVNDAFNHGANSPVVDIVGLSGVDAESTDACFYGASGSGSMSADGVPLLSLSTRHQVDPYNNGSFDSNQDQTMAYTTTLKIEDALGIDVSGFDVLCSYATVGPSEINTLLSAEPAVPYDANVAVTGK